MYIYLPIILFIAVVLIAGFRIAQEYQRGVVFRLGRYSGQKGPGLYWIIPLIDRQQMIDLRTTTMALQQQETITKDSVTIKVDAVLWYKVVDPAKSVINVVNCAAAVYQVAQTSLRNIIGQHMLDEVLRERDKINETLQTIIDTTTKPWGIHIELMEMKDVEIPEAMQRAMAREAEAVREKRARIIKAEAELEASEKLAFASKQMEGNSAALELRRLQMVSEVGAEHNSTTIILLPSEFVSMAKGISDSFSKSRSA